MSEPTPAAHAAFVYVVVCVVVGVGTLLYLGRRVGKKRKELLKFCLSASRACGVGRASAGVLRRDCLLQTGKGFEGGGISGDLEGGAGFNRSDLSLHRSAALLSLLSVK